MGAEKRYSEMLKTELLEIAQRLGLTKLSRLRKNEIIDLIERGTKRMSARKRPSNTLAAREASTSSSPKQPGPSTKPGDRKGKKAPVQAAATKGTEPASKAQPRQAGAKASAPASDRRDERPGPRPAQAMQKRPAVQPAQAAQNQKGAPAAAPPKRGTQESTKAAPLRVRPSKAQPGGGEEGALAPRPREPLTVQVRPPDMEALRAIDEDLPAIEPGENRIVLMPRDPAWLYAYWTLTEEYKQAARDAGGENLALRLYDVSDAPFDGRNPQQEHGCEEWARSWYVPVPRAGRTYLVEIGYRGGYQWFPLARSNRVDVPGDQPSASAEVTFATIVLEDRLPEAADAIVTAAAQPAQVLAAAAAEARPVAGSQPPAPGEAASHVAGSLGAAGELHVAGSLVAGSQVPGSRLPVAGIVPGQVAGSQIAGSVAPVAGSIAPVPGSHVPGSHVPGSHVPGSHVPGSHVPGSHVLGVDLTQARPIAHAVARGAVFYGPGHDSPQLEQEPPVETRTPRLLRATAELVIAGHAMAGTRVSIGGRQLPVGPDGSFSLRIPLPEGLGDLSIEGQQGAELEHVHLWFGQLTEVKD